MVREDMYFPFSTCEVKCAAKHAECKAVAVKGTVTLFRRIKREEKLHQAVLAFFVPHDKEAVLIYVHSDPVNEIDKCFTVIQ
jgi:hypothetical protein